MVCPAPPTRRRLESGKLRSCEERIRNRRGRRGHAARPSAATQITIAERNEKKDKQTPAFTARPPAATKTYSRQDAKNAKKTKTKPGLNLGALCVFARNLTSFAVMTYTAPCERCLPEKQAVAPLQCGGESDCRQGPLHLRRKLDENELAAMIEVIFTTFVNHAKKVILGRLFIRKDFIDLPHDQRCLVIGIVNTHSELSLGSIHKGRLPQS
jgi:hypothetical protein